MIGASEFGEYWQGLISDVRVYNKALSLAGTLNSTFGGPCSATEAYAIATASIIGDSSCGVIPTNPPLITKIGAAATGLKVGPGSAQLKFGQVPQ
jgi:hypothetical protein